MIVQMNSVAVYANCQEYKAVKVAKDAISADAKASKIFTEYVAFQEEIQN